MLEVATITAYASGVLVILVIAFDWLVRHWPAPVAAPRLAVVEEPLDELDDLEFRWPA